MITDIEFDELMELRKTISENRNWGENLSDKDFIKGMYLLNPQSYGARIEKRIQQILGFGKNKAKDNCGDLLSNSGKNVEVKVSILSPVNNALNLVQIRPFHNIDYYLCVAYDCRDMKSFKTYIFLLSHDEMKQECKSASAAHGTATVNEENSNVELRLSIICEDNNELFNQWKAKYLINSFDEIKNVLQ